MNNRETTLTEIGFTKNGYQKSYALYKYDASWYIDFWKLEEYDDQKWNILIDDILYDIKVTKEQYYKELRSSKGYILAKKEKLKTEEQILCAAIWLKEVERPTHRPINTPGGIVFCGFRHGDCIGQIVAITGKRLHEHGEHIQGFLTNKNRFVDREEGAEIWIKSGGELKYSKNELYSEDLY